MTTGMGAKAEATTAGGLAGGEFKDVTPTTFHSGMSAAEVTGMLGRVEGVGAATGVMEAFSAPLAAAAPVDTGNAVMPAIFQSLVPAAKSASKGI